MTNKEYQLDRAAQAPDSLLAQLKKAIEDYDEREGCGLRSAVRDVLTDVRHLCDVFELNFGEIDDDAHEGYLEELGQLKDEPISIPGEPAPE